MENQPQRDTGPELKIRSILHRLGFRYRVDYQPIKGIRRRADVAFIGPRVTVFVDGCFWHGCPEHGTWPKANSKFWRNKIETNKKRDAETTKLLEKAGWKVVRVWEHEDPVIAAKKIAGIVRDG
jgi:DNA mismatch endonuclease (patch repair protein)